MSEASSRTFHVAPLRPMAGDVEILSGDPEKPGEPFVMRIRELPGTIIPLHSHPVDENITVVQGTWYFAVGEKWDRSALKELRAGDYAFAPKGSTMFGYCPDGAIVQVHGVGPFVIHWLHGAKTLSDPDAAGTFKFRKGEHVKTARGEGIIKEGYASGEIVQYEIETASGVRFMANESETQRL
jgi:quercetin dioxygenase-like cupin family protein